MAVSQDVFVINEGFSERVRTTSSGTKTRFTLEVKTEPVIINLSEIALGKPVAEALRKAISDGIKNISAVASPATLLKRKYDATAFARGAKHAVKKFSGGKIGAMPPGQSDRLFNNSGRLAASIYAMQNPKEGNWTINVAANRLDPSTFSTREAFVSMVDRLRQFVPVLRDPLGHPAVKQAIDASISNMIQVTDDRTFKAKLALVKQGIALLQNVSNLLGG